MGQHTPHPLLTSASPALSAELTSPLLLPSAHQLPSTGISPGRVLGGKGGQSWVSRTSTPHPYPGLQLDLPWARALKGPPTLAFGWDQGTAATASQLTQSQGAQAGHGCALDRAWGQGPVFPARGLQTTFWGCGVNPDLTTYRPPSPLLAQSPEPCVQSGCPLGTL